MTARLRQILVGYTPEEDRLLLRFATSEQIEIRLFLTRRFVQMLWEALVRIMEERPDLKVALKPEAKKAVLSFEHEEAVRSGTYIKRFDDEEALSQPLGKTPLLVTGAHCKPLAGGATQVGFRTRGGKTITVNLEKKLLHSLCHLLVGACQKAEWDLELTLGDVPAAPAEAGDQLH